MRAIHCSTLLIALILPWGNTATAGEILSGDVFFTDNAMVTASVLASSTAYSDISFEFADMTVFGGNDISASAMDHSFGVMAINQNTAPSANIQQAVTVQMNIGDEALAKILEIAN